jgi:hypothetical protein
MGSLNNGQPILQTNNLLRVHHQGTLLKLGNTQTDLNTVIANSGTIRDIGSDTLGVAWQPNNTVSVTLSGLSAPARDADNSVEREKFTVTGLPSGNLLHIATRKIAGIHTSVSSREATSTLAPYETVTERKIFFVDSDRTLSSGLADWTIFDNSGGAAGATTGVTDIDITPAATFAGASGETPV